MMRLSCASTTGSPTILAFLVLDFFMVDLPDRRTQAYSPAGQRAPRHLPDGPSREAGRAPTLHFSSKNGVLRALTELWPNIGGSRVPQGQPQSHMKLVSIDVRFEYPVNFTSDVFDGANDTLAQAIRRKEPGRRHRALLVLDKGVIDSR